VAALSDDEYARLLALRSGLRRFLHWSAEQAEKAGLTPAQHQLLLAIRGHPDPAGPTISQVADYLLLRHHSVVGLVDRSEAAGLVRRLRSEQDHRVVRLKLTSEGRARLEALSTLHLEELRRLGLDLPNVAVADPTMRSGADPPPTQLSLAVGRVYDPLPAGSTGVLVDRLWPRGVSKQEAPFSQWYKNLAPSAQLRRWYGHDPARFAEFARRYRLELAAPEAQPAIEALRASARSKMVVLLTATRDLQRSGAAVLREVLAGSYGV